MAVDSIILAHVADAIERVGGDVAGYDDAADMAAEMLQRFPSVMAMASQYANGDGTVEWLDDAVLTALQGF